MWIDKKRFLIEEASNLAGVEKTIILQWIQDEWISPAESEPLHLDEEDVARVKLIQNLIADFGVNREGISIVLHILDQLHYLQNRITSK
jgi:chaperone modulatory protein CbpM